MIAERAVDTMVLSLVVGSEEQTHLPYLIEAPKGQDLPPFVMAAYRLAMTGYVTIQLRNHRRRVDVLVTPTWAGRNAYYNGRLHGPVTTESTDKQREEA